MKDKIIIIKKTIKILIVKRKSGVTLKNYLKQKS